ncbi:MAG: phosphate/phosphite/phosphonate ABC transporter substrate-binding protein [Granulosicoccaceae bacterium]
MAQARDVFPANPVYTFAVVPQYTPLTVHRRWRPLLDELSKQSGITYQLRIYDNFNEFINDLKQGQPDFAYLAPYHLVLARRAQGYIPLIRDSSTNLQGLVVVPKNSPYRDIRELDGKQIDFPSPNAFAASLYLRAYLQEHEKISFTPRYLGNHDNVYRHVATGFSEAGGGVNTTLSRQPAGLQARLRVLFRIPAVASHPVAVHPRIPEHVRKNFVKLITTWVTRGKPQEYLDRVQFSKPVMANYDKDYAPLESLHLDKYQIEGGDQ